MKQEGFWYSKYEPHFPVPVAGDPYPQQAEVLVKLEQAERESEQLCFRGWSLCRICGIVNGSVQHRKDWEWPGGYRHYIEKHNIRPSKEFAKEVLGITLE